jgi:MFS family permease
VGLTFLSFLLGLFSRGTSPVIKALVFDGLAPHQMRRGSALYTIGGEGGSAIGQAVFGLLLAYFGIFALAPRNSLVEVLIFLEIRTTNKRKLFFIGNKTW